MLHYKCDKKIEFLLKKKGGIRLEPIWWDTLHCSCLNNNIYMDFCICSYIGLSSFLYAYNFNNCVVDLKLYNFK